MRMVMKVMMVRRVVGMIVMMVKVKVIVMVMLMMMMVKLEGDSDDGVNDDES